MQAEKKQKLNEIGIDALMQKPIQFNKYVNCDEKKAEFEDTFTKNPGLRYFF